MTHRNRTRRLVSGAFALATALTGTFATISPAIAEVEEIIVTVERREESIQDVSTSITALGAKQIVEFGIERASEIADQAPNIIIEDQFGLTGPTISVRGVVNADFNAASNTPVTIYSDGVVLNSIQDHGFAMFDVERVEMLRGPQGTFFGRNSTTGAIQFFSAQPTEEFSGYGRATIGSFGQTRFEGAVSGPIVEGGLLGRLSFVKNDASGHIRNTFTGKKTPKADDFSIRTILATPDNGGAFSANLKLQYTRGKGEPIIFHNALPTNTITGEPGGAASHFREIALDFEGRLESIEAFFAALRMSYDFGGVILTSITGYSEHDFENYNDDDATEFLFLNEYFANDQDQFSQEITLTSNNDTPFEWIVGLYYLTEDVASQTSFDFSGLVGIPGVGFASDNQFTQDLTSYAAFGQGTYRFSDAFSITAGLRWSRDEKDFMQTLTPCFAFDPTLSDYTQIDQGEVFVDPAGGCPANGTVTLADAWSNWSGKVSLEFTPNDETLVYVSVARGIKGGGFNGGAASLDEVSTVIPEKLTAYEVGGKFQFLDRRATFNVSAFYYDYKDMQQFALGASETTNVLARNLLNVDKGRSYGAEFELYTELVDNLVINLGLGLVDTEFRDFVDAGGTSYNGNEFIGAANVNFNGLVQYRLPLGNVGFLTLQADWVYIGHYFVDIDNSPLTAGGFWNLNLRATLTNIDEWVSLSFFVENVTNEIQFTNHFDTSGAFGTSISTLRKPRSWGVTLSAEF